MKKMQSLGNKSNLRLKLTSQKFDIFPKFRIESKDYCFGKYSINKNKQQTTNGKDHNQQSKSDNKTKSFSKLSTYKYLGNKYDNKRPSSLKQRVCFQNKQNELKINAKILSSKVNEILSLLKLQNVVVQRDGMVSIMKEHFNIIINLIINSKSTYSKDDISRIFNSKRQQKMINLQSCQSVKSKRLLIETKNKVLKIQKTTSAHKKDQQHSFTSPLSHQSINQQLEESFQNYQQNQLNNSKIITPFQYMSEQNKLLAKVASEELKKTEAEILSFGFQFHQRLLDEDLQYFEFTRQKTESQSQKQWKESISSIINDPVNKNLQKQEKIIQATNKYLQCTKTMNSQLKKIIDIKSALISKITLTIEKWVDRLTFRKEFITNLMQYVHLEFVNLYKMINCISKVNEVSRDGKLVENIVITMKTMEQNLERGNQFY